MNFSRYFILLQGLFIGQALYGMSILKKLGNVRSAALINRTYLSPKTKPGSKFFPRLISTQKNTTPFRTQNTCQKKKRSNGLSEQTKRTNEAFKNVSWHRLTINGWREAYAWGISPRANYESGLTRMIASEIDIIANSLNEELLLLPFVIECTEEKNGKDSVSWDKLLGYVERYIENRCCEKLGLGNAVIDAIRSKARELFYNYFTDFHKTKLINELQNKPLIQDACKTKEYIHTEADWVEVQEYIDQFIERRLKQLRTELPKASVIKVQDKIKAYFDLERTGIPQLEISWEKLTATSVREEEIEPPFDK